MDRSVDETSLTVPRSSNRGVDLGRSAAISFAWRVRCRLAVIRVATQRLMGRRRRSTAESRQALREMRAELRDPAPVMDAAAAFLSVRPRSVTETRQRLHHLGYPHALVDTVIDRLIEMDYLDDAAFARDWVESRDRARPRGETALRRELALKGVPREVVDEVACRSGRIRTDGDPNTTAAVASAIAPSLRARTRAGSRTSPAEGIRAARAGTASTPKPAAKAGCVTWQQMSTSHFAMTITRASFLLAYLGVLAVLVFLSVRRAAWTSGSAEHSSVRNDRTRPGARDTVLSFRLMLGNIAAFVPFGLLLPLAFRLRWPVLQSGSRRWRCRSGSSSVSRRSRSGSATPTVDRHRRRHPQRAWRADRRRGFAIWQVAKPSAGGAVG